MFGFETVSGGMSPLMTVLIVVFAVLFLGAIGKGLWVWIRNNRSPVETVDATVTAKRTKVTGHGRTMAARTASAMYDTGSTYTDYFATFELADGKRVKLRVKDAEFGMLSEGDRGRLTFQGTRYHGFERF